MNVRYFRTADESEYERARATLDALWNLPSNGQQTCFEPAETAPRDAKGNLYLSLWAFYCDIPEAAAILVAMLESGLVAEITHDEYFSAVGPSSPFVEASQL
jgi:hypothetical protein